MKDNKKIIEEALKKAKEEEKQHIESVDELEEEDAEFNQESKRLRKIVTKKRKN